MYACTYTQNQEWSRFYDDKRKDRIIEVIKDMEANVECTPDDQRHPTPDVSPERVLNTPVREHFRRHHCDLDSDGSPF